MKRLQLNQKDKKFLGVCAGIADYLEIDVTVIRVLWIIGTLLTGVVGGVLAYFLVAMIVPKKGL